MRGIKGLSETLNLLVETLPTDQLRSVAKHAFELASEDFPDDSVIKDAVRQFTAGNGVLNEPLSLELARQSQEADDRYFQLEDSGADKATYMREFCRARVLYALSLVFAAREINSTILDDVVYELGHGAANIDQYVGNLEKLIRMSVAREGGK